MKRLLILLMAAMLLVACAKGNEDVDSVGGNSEGIKNDTGIDVEDTVSEGIDDEILMLSEDDYEVELFENEDMKMTLKKKEHVRVDYTEVLTLHAEIENKKERTFQLVLVDLSVDGVEYRLDSLFVDHDEVEPADITGFEFGVFSEEEIKFNEHVKGNIKYMDYEGNVKDIEFNKYIND